MPPKKLIVKVKKLHPNAKLPTSVYAEDVGYDVYALENVRIPYGATREIETGIAIEPPTGYYFTVETRSSYGKAGKVAHRGIVDPNYRGDITVHMRNVSTNQDTKETMLIKKGDKIAQIVFHKTTYIAAFVEVAKLSETERGDKGHGSSGR